MDNQGWIQDFWKGGFIYIERGVGGSLLILFHFSQMSNGEGVDRGVPHSQFPPPSPHFPPPSPPLPSPVSPTSLPLLPHFPPPIRFFPPPDKMLFLFKNQSVCILNSKRNAYFAYLVKCINWGLNTDLMIRKVSLMYGTCVLSNASQMDGSLEY